ncbi:MAG: TIGR01459 family HAD-type hydrolase [Candidatus Puniceispirillum sp.]|nr:TIGR01459 family HAD-type hydrolase [Candidatus Pelagibacter sp.]MBA4283463.1 TIGR01459 family HAD-type hydrolase [Candidatus Puniceispirillum sp.]
MTQIISSLLDYSSHYDVYFIDLWGLTHNGKEPFPSAIDVFKKLKEQGKTLIVISNAPRVPDMVRHLLKTNMNIDTDQLFDSIITSGLVCRQHIEKKYKGQKLYHIGPERDFNLYENLCESVPLNEADFVLLTGTEGWETSTADFTEVLTEIAHLRLPVLCANADKYVYIGDSKYICAGALAAQYQEITKNLNLKDGTDLIIFGKPYPEVFDLAMQEAAHFQTHLDKNRIIMLGDSLDTDIAGANQYGIHSLFTHSGVHKNESWDALEVKMEEPNLNPIFSIQGCLK